MLAYYQRKKICWHIINRRIYIGVLPIEEKNMLAYSQQKIICWHILNIILYVDIFLTADYKLVHSQQKNI